MHSTVSGREFAMPERANLGVIYICQNDKREGPYTHDQILALLDSGSIVPFTLAWTEGMTEWAPLNTVLPGGSIPPPIPSSHSPIPQVSATASGAAQKALRPGDIGGWLLFFCVSLIVLSPVFSIWQMVTNWQASESFFSIYPTIEIAVVLENLWVVGLLVYGVLVGLDIRRGNHRGRAKARGYLRGRLFGFIGIEIMVLLVASDTPSSLYSTLVVAVIGTCIREVIVFSIWWAYFKNSKRVRDTYGAPD
jgi:hypothetical protein